MPPPPVVVVVVWLALLAAMLAQAEGQATRYQGAQYMRGSPVAFSTQVEHLHDCVKTCLQWPDGCVAFWTGPPYQGEGPLCEVYEQTYSPVSQPTVAGVLYTIIPAGQYNNPAPLSVTRSSGTPPPECPVVWRRWEEISLEYWSGTSSSVADPDNLGDHGPDKAWDIDNSTVFRTMSGEEYPWLQLDLGRPHRVTTVWLVSGNQTITNLDVRVGNTSFADDGGMTMNVDTARCTLYPGPSQLPGELIELDCSSPRGLFGQFVTLQMAERFANNSLEIAEVRVDGFARVCADSFDYF